MKLAPMIISGREYRPSVLRRDFRRALVRGYLADETD
jgi:hypothetical protein